MLTGASRPQSLVFKYQLTRQLNSIRSAETRAEIPNQTRKKRWQGGVVLFTLKLSINVLHSSAAVSVHISHSGMSEDLHTSQELDSQAAEFDATASRSEVDACARPARKIYQFGPIKRSRPSHLSRAIAFHDYALSLEDPYNKSSRKTIYKHSGLVSSWCVVQCKRAWWEAWFEMAV